MKGKMYTILVNNEGNGWKEFDNIWRTEKEANRDLRNYRLWTKGFNVKFRKKLVYKGPIMTIGVISVPASSGC